MESTKRASPVESPSSALYREIVENAFEGVWVVDAAGMTTYVNRRTTEMIGVPAEELIGKPFDFFMDESTRRSARAKLARRRSGVAEQHEFRFIRPDGTPLWALVSANPVIASDGSFVGAVALLSDLSAQKAVEADIRTLNETLEEKVCERSASLETANAELARSNEALAKTNKELEAFSYTVSHDLRAPLRAIDGFSRILLDEHADGLTGEARRCLANIRTGAARMAELIDALLRFSLLSRQAIQPVRCDATLQAKRAASALAGDLEGRSVDLRIDDLPSCRADRVLLDRVFTNLLSNAIKFTRQRSHPEIVVGSQRADDPAMVCYFVRDNGIGFDPEYSDKLFGVFSRLHVGENFEGMGIGLAIVERVVTRHGGAVSAESAPERGATFRFTLPRGDTDG